MKTIALSAIKRTEVGSVDAKQIRKEGNIPCNIYGVNGNTNFHVNAIIFNKIINSPEVYFVDLDIDGKKHKAIIKEVQFHPVTDKTLHVDFLEVSKDKLVNVTLPVKTTGTSKGVLAGGKLRMVTRRLKVRGLVEDLPEFIEVDITSLKIGQTFKVADLNVKGLTFLDAANAVVVAVKMSRVATVVDDEEEVVEASAEQGAEASTEVEATPAE
ncbi:MAG: 50S ribosomal protein L25 [Flavobacteriales bacterium CG18_big_fil_WC_8_21_14_2_50_32_9]|nr:50S ribosomal protein L25 [Flavobacteriales bacterium]PIQ15140.1 MAG: 50S ribosomal protein L25 [Flavobacteriales bacterium CG18_big_fil_WC_8_21_14_2_50_32_9]PIZ05390.1 MAG: 50S ribosomal protein L25 [Flavobacteriales bacterium CG_4_10_14_0_8_um_filter_32_5]PJC62501.1 MAG: 50S ribosomal protein L25 [Flavobacteriales bacterium CG_4_9_14_0_2_um_filter_32_27]